MATIHAKHLSILRSLVEAGCKDEKQIASLTIRDAVKLPRSCRIELASVLECMQAVKENKLLSYLVDNTDETAVDGHET